MIRMQIYDLAKRDHTQEQSVSIVGVAWSLESDHETVSLGAESGVGDIGPFSPLVLVPWAFYGISMKSRGPYFWGDSRDFQSCF